MLKTVVLLNVFAKTWYIFSGLFDEIDISKEQHLFETENIFDQFKTFIQNAE